jgi:hypothetical protein
MFGLPSICTLKAVHAYWQGSPPANGACRLHVLTYLRAHARSYRHFLRVGGQERVPGRGGRARGRGSRVAAGSAGDWASHAAARGAAGVRRGMPGCTYDYRCMLSCHQVCLRRSLLRGVTVRLDDDSERVLFPGTAGVAGSAVVQPWTSGCLLRRQDSPHCDRSLPGVSGFSFAPFLLPSSS